MLLNFIYPKTCAGCGRWGRYICSTCINKLEFITKPICVYCEKRSYMGLTHPWCMRKEGIDGYLGVFRYNTTLKKIVKNIKYRLVTDSFKELFKLLDRQDKMFVDFQHYAPAAFLVPIPLHKDRQLKRGFNQAEIITNHFSCMYSYPVLQPLTRPLPTAPQAQLSVEERQRNMRGVFKMKNGVRLPSKPLILVDDVVTTGSTVGDAAATLKKAGVKQVFVFSLAKG